METFFFSHSYEIFWAWKWRGELFTFIYFGCAWLDYRVKKDKHEWIHLWGKNKIYFYLFRKMKIFPIMLERVFFFVAAAWMGRSFCHSSNSVPLIAAISQIKWMISVCILTDFVKVGECVFDENSSFTWNQCESRICPNQLNRCTHTNKCTHS